MTKTVCAAAAALLLTTMRGSAHHAFTAEYDENKRVTVSGTVTKFEWINPHTWLHVDRKDESGKVTSWSFEMGSPNGVVRGGWRRTELKEGDQVTPTPALTMPEGRKLFGGFQSTPGAPVT
jgi:hypothetical protein